MDSWLNDVYGLFNGTLNALMTVPVFRFFLACILFFSAVSLLALLVHSGRNGKL